MASVAIGGDGPKMLKEAIREAGKRLPFKSRKQQNEVLEFAADDLTDAYRIGAEEAQREIIIRLQILAEEHTER